MLVIHGFNGKPNDYSWKDLKVREYVDEFESLTRQFFIKRGEK